MSVLGNIRYYQRLAAGLSAYLRLPIDQHPSDVIRNQMINREARWLGLVRDGVFQSPRNLYQALFEAAGCQYGDLERIVAAEGLERALAALRDGGVYLTHTEFKGRGQIVRSGRTVWEGARAFANPLVAGWLRMQSSGSRGAVTQSAHNTGQMRHRDAYWALHFDDLGLRDRLNFPVRPVLPSAAGLVTLIGYARQGCEIGRWFAIGGSLEQSAHYRALTNGLVALARWNGLKIPWPSHLPPNDFSPVARALADARAAGQPCTMAGVASTGVRVAAAALERGWDISGSLFILSGETVSDAKRRYVESAGVRVKTMYWISEVGPIGWSCSETTGSDAVHVLRDSVAVVKHRHLDALSGLEVEPLLFTTLLPCAANLLINADMGDCARLEPASCGCRYTAAGFTEHVRDISSYAKLTGQGMTLVGTDIVRILEEALPAQFGGAPGDYQLVEQESAGGTKLVLRVDPRAGPAPADAIRSMFLAELRRWQGGALASRVWEHSGALSVAFIPPATIGGGKVLPLHLLGVQRIPRSDATAVKATRSQPSG